MTSQLKQCILVVDDEPLNIKVLTQALLPWYRVKATPHGTEVMDIALSDDPPDLILLDISMPDLDGYEVCAQLKARRETQSIPVLFLSARSSPEDEARGLGLGAVDYITKPPSIAIVMARIRNHLLLKTRTDILEELVAIDSLTQVANRRHFDERLGQEWRRCQRAGTPLSLIMIDVDFFKNLNDSFGHAAGDLCLKQVAEALKACMRRSSDTVARYGGEEFACILPDMTGEEATELAELLREKVESLGLSNPLAGKPDNQVTISVGLASTLPSSTSNMETVLHNADAALYTAKEKGRNQVVAASVAAIP